jgi:hypothetical protein
MGHPYTTTTVAWIFFDNIVTLNNIPSSIVNDRDPVFMGQFWKELFSLASAKLQMSSAFHLQSNGQSKATNKIITMHLRCLTGDRPKQWLHWLPWVEFSYNSSFQTSLKTSPFKVIYGKAPPSLRDYTPGEAHLSTVQSQLMDQDEFIMEIRNRLDQAQQQYKLFYDRKHMEVTIQEG